MDQVLLWLWSLMALISTVPIECFELALGHAFRPSTLILLVAVVDRIGASDPSLVM